MILPLLWLSSAHLTVFGREEEGGHTSLVKCMQRLFNEFVNWVISLQACPNPITERLEAPGVRAHGKFPCYTEVYIQIDDAKLPVINEYSRERFHVQICLGSARL